MKKMGRPLKKNGELSVPRHISLYPSEWDKIDQMREYHQCPTLSDLIRRELIDKGWIQGMDVKIDKR